MYIDGKESWINLIKAYLKNDTLPKKKKKKKLRRLKKDHLFII